MNLKLSRTLVCGLSVLLVATAAYAGPSLLCWPFNIDGAKSLPFQGPNWSEGQPGYDVNHLVADTTALLTPQTPVLVRMETLRRATIYARYEPAIADALLQQLKQRADAAAKRTDREAALARFDLGYLAATYKQAAAISVDAHKTFWKFDQRAPQEIDAYALVTTALRQTHDPEMEFAAAAMKAEARDADYQQHLANAVANAKPGSLLARNLDSHFAADISALRQGTLASKR